MKMVKFANKLLKQFNAVQIDKECTSLFQRNGKPVAPLQLWCSGCKRELTKSERAEGKLCSLCLEEL